MVAEKKDVESTFYTVEDVEKHREYEDCWIILGEKGERRVYDITSFLDDHPGGPEILMDLAGKDAHDEFEDIGHSKDARDMLPALCIGRLKESAAAEKPKSKNSATSSAVIAETPGHGNHMLLMVAAILVICFAYLVKPVET